MKCFTAAPKAQPTTNMMSVFSIIPYKRVMCMYIVLGKEKGAQPPIAHL